MKDKAALRAEARSRIATIEEADRAAAAEAIAGRVWALPEMQAARAILVYAELPGEVPTGPVVAEARRRGVEVVYPRCLPEGREMTLHSVASDAELLAGGRYGIREPAQSCPITDLEAIDVALIPGLAWDRHGTRLGRGAGYYDRLLSSPRWRALRCGIYFAAQEFPALVEDEWDVPLEAIVTEREVWRVPER